MRKEYKSILFILLFFSASLGMQAQERMVSGTVTDATGETLPGVSVLIKGTQKGTETDFDGKYAIKVKQNSVLVFSFVGKKTVEKLVGASSTINVTLEEGDNILEEVVIVGYGTARKITSVVGSITTVNSDELKEKPSPNMLDGLQGKVAGLQVFTSSGEPSASSSFRLHGVGSLGGSSTPLVVLDGVPISSGAIVSLNPNDFESVTILKDASSTSIYGSRAANGVVYITTKKGRRNQDATITVRTQYGISNLANTDFFENAMNRDELSKFWVATGYRSQAFVDNLLKNNPSDTKWYKVYYKSDVPIIQNDVSISGGGEKTSYFISTSHTEQGGLAYQSDFERYTLRSNIDSKVKDWVSVGVNLSIGYDERQLNPSGRNSTNRGLSWLAQPWFSPTNPTTGERYDFIPGWGRYHPAYREEVFPSISKNLQFNPSGYVSIKPIDNLTIKTQAGIDFFDFTVSTQTLPSFIGSPGNGSAFESFARNTTKTITSTLEYKYSLNDVNNFIFLAGHELVDNDFRSFDGASRGQTDDRLLELDAGSNNITVNQSSSEYVFESLFSRLEYNYDEKYFADASVRQDGSSRFGAKNRKATFWSVGGMWKAKKEQFLQDVDWLTDLTVRASYGTSGNSGLGNYQSLATVSANQYDSSTGFQIGNPGNPALTWEKQSKASLALNMTLFDRVRLNLEGYNRITKSQLVSVPLAPSTGFTSITKNVGELTNRGIDVELNFDVLKSKEAYITPYLTFNYNSQKVTELFNGLDRWIIPNTGVAWIVGQPVSYFYPIHAGVNPQTGLSEWYVPGSDNTVTNKDKNNVTSSFNTAALQQNLGIKRQPPLNGGFGFSAGYKGITLQTDFSFSLGKYLLNNDRFFSENPNLFRGFNASKRVLDYWKKPGDVTTFPRYDGPRFTQFDSTLIEDASFVRLKTLTLGYNLPKEVMSKTGFKNLRVFLVGRNLLTFTKYLGVDPEVDSNIALGSNPNTKQMSLGVEIKF
ncbi:MAG: SusC/RagA family TonB-linked outer membrane protein [Flavobacteriaceae bacterium]|nr:SusC/RagA family TonB-linked outer membrane protein [Flavobacteriaceae bacterium]